ncbi:thioredoxin domain-containing protein [Fundidesulfovibrio butyratiphilus]
MNRTPNALIREKSPYLLEHAHNPVNWLPWGEEALDKARREDKPLFLSIGYASCHWCHVMERESFLDDEVADLLNAYTVPVKIDREERPDLDGVYMAACHALTGSGGWPLSVFADASGRPFLATTYVPKHTRFGRTGMLDLVAAVHQAWTHRRPEVDKAARSVEEALAKLQRRHAPAATLDPTLFAEAERILTEQFDAENGGFGQAPKFPSPHVLLFLLERFRRTGRRELADMAGKTLTAMRLGGLFDQIGLGFHRYSTDAVWLLPHFEKMLYDQAMLALAYTEAWQTLGDPLFSRAAQETLAYVLQDLRGPEGELHCAQDADSEGVEGKYFVWTTAEVEAVLGPEKAAEFLRVYGFSPQGNFLEEATGHPTGTNIPHLAAPPSEDEEARLAPMRQALLAARRKRVPPRTDDKTLTDWNGLTITALARAARVFDRKDLALAAEQAARFVLDRLRDPTGRLLHRYRDGQAAVPGNLDDHAYFARGLVELHQATGQQQWLDLAVQIAETMIDHFADPDEGFFFTADDAPTPLLRRKEFYDAAMPSGNSAALGVLRILANLTARVDFKERATALAKAAWPQAAEYPPGFAMLLCEADKLIEA